MQSQFLFRIQSHLPTYTYNFFKCRFARTYLIRRDGDLDLDPRDRAFDCKERGAIVKRSKPGWERRSLSTWSAHFYSCPAVEAVAGSFTVEAGGLMELIRSTTEMEPPLEPRSEAIPPETGQQESIAGLEPAIQRLTMEVTEAAESTSEKRRRRKRTTAVEEQAVVAAPVKLHDLSVCPLWLGFIPEHSF